VPGFQLAFVLAAATVAVGLSIVLAVLRPSQIVVRPQPVRSELREAEAA
jgi:hypothetical protein